MKMTIPNIKIDPAALITDKQANFIDTLGKERDWKNLPTSVTIVIRQVNRWFANGKLDPLDVKRQAASAAISALLAPTTPKVAATAAAAASKPLVTSDWQTLKLKLAPLPISKYAVQSTTDPEQFVFFEVVERKSGARFVNKLIGAPGDWKRVNLSLTQQITVADKIAEDPTAHATRYCEIYTRCSCCDSPLSDKKSIAQAMGPVCSKKFVW